MPIRLGRGVTLSGPQWIKKKKEEPKPEPLPAWKKRMLGDLDKINSERNPRPVKGRGIKNVPGPSKKKKELYNPYAK